MVSLLTCHSVFYLLFNVVQVQTLTGARAHPVTWRLPPSPQAPVTGLGRWHAPLSRRPSFTEHRFMKNLEKRPPGAGPPRARGAVRLRWPPAQGVGPVAEREHCPQELRPSAGPLRGPNAGVGSGL